MMSVDASGTLAGTFTFGKWKGRNVVRSHAVPSNPRSASQRSTRAMMNFLSKAWTNLSTAQKATFDTLAAQYAISPFNAYVRHNMRRWTQFEGPQIEIGSTAGTAPTLGTLTANGGVGIIEVSQAITSAADMWGVMFAVNASDGFTPGHDDLRFAKYGTASPVAGTIVNLAAGTYYVTAAGIAEDGTLSSWLTDVEVTVT